MIKELYKLTDNYFIGSIDRHPYKDDMCIFIKIIYHAAYETIPVIDINVGYDYLIDFLKQEYASKETLIKLISKDLRFKNNKKLQQFINELINQYNIDINNFNFELSKIIVNIFINQIFI